MNEAIPAQNAEYLAGFDPAAVAESMGGLLFMAEELRDLPVEVTAMDPRLDSLNSQARIILRRFGR